MPAPSLVESMLSHAVISVFSFSLLFSVHDLPVYNLLPFRVERKVLGIITCCFIVPDLNGLRAITILSIVVIGKPDYILDKNHKGIIPQQYVTVKEQLIY